jgi:signal transduction histidine kinase
MIASASLTLAAIHSVVWYKNRLARLHLLFALTAVSVAAFTYCELWSMRAETPADLLAAVKWAQLSLLCLLVSMTCVVAIYLRAPRLWLAWVACGLRAVFVLVNNLGAAESPSLQHVRFLGESVTVLSGIPNPAMPLGQFAALLILVFVADASIAAWRRGERRQALMVGGSVEFFLLAAMGTSIAVIWGRVQAPVIFSLLYLGVVAVMGYELSSGVLRASQLVLELQDERGRLEASNSQISDMFGRLIAAQETERTRIARDLHDDVSQRLAGLSIMMSGIKRRLAGEPHADLVPAVTSMQESASALAEEIRHFSHNLHPALLEHAGLGAALRACCAEFEKLHGIKVACSAGADTEQVESATALCLFRIAQEALRNVAKHADARRVALTLTQTPDGVQLSIADDGKGFDLAGARGAAAGLGLVSIDERARLLRGSVQIDTQPRGGTRLHVRIPLRT